MESIVFEEAIAKIEEVIEDLESGKLGLEESLQRFETGINLLGKCHGLLNQAVGRISVLAKDNDVFTLEDWKGDLDNEGF